MRLGPGFRLVAALALMLCAGTLAAQSFDLGRGREPLVSLDGWWQFHPGDSPLQAGLPIWATPGFDDSGWPLLRGGKPWSVQGYPGMSGFAWYRFKVNIPAGSKPTDLLLAPLLSSYQVYIDGRLCGQVGQMPTYIPSTFMSYGLYSLTAEPNPAPRTIQVAIRVWHAPIWAGYVGGGSFLPGNLAGDPSLLLAEQEHQRLARNIRYVDAWSYSITAALVGIAILCLFFFRPAEREYLWFAAMLLPQAADNALYVLEQVFFWPPIAINDLTDGIFIAIYICAALCFFSRVLDVRAGAVGRIALVLAAFSPVAAVLYWPGWASPPAAASTQIVCLLPAVTWILCVLVERSWHGNLDARLLLLPTLLDLGFYFADNLAIVLGQAGFIHWPRILEYALPLPPYTVQVGILFHLVFLLALLVFLIRRFALATRREQRLQGELEAAREVQQVLLPDQLDQFPGFQVDFIYQPAEQVGGDFFQQIADDRGGILVVMGDVSGKGLPAAMMVSVLVGAIRAEAAHGADPRAMLVALNDRMMGRCTREGFVTCLAAHLSASGLLTIANAGHLPPYLNGRELSIPSSLPMGVVAQPDYDEIALQLAHGDRLTFVSDGVVEARSRSGELFGFDRTRKLSTHSAEEIARAARAFGQEDDITVLTLTFAPAEVLHA